MTNIYEQLLLTDKAALESKIANLVAQKLKDCEEAEEELILISKVIDFSMDIEASCSFEVDCPVLSATKNFCSVEDYKDRDHYETAEDAECDGISWDADTNDGSFSWDGCPSVSVEVEGLTEDASEEAKTLWDTLRREQQHQKQLDWKRKRLEETQKELLKLQADLAAAAETNA
jgi:hypothetical protein